MAQPQTRMTRQRAVILEELRKVKTHPTADELYSIVRERLPRISLGCIHCGRIGDVMQPLPVPSVAGMQVEGFYSVVDSRVEFDGICDACAAKGLK